MFLAKTRVDKNYAGYSEPICSFLDRSALLIANNVRELLETWFANYPVADQKLLLPRLKSTNDNELRSAFFELYTHELLSRMGLSVEIHPHANESVLKRPDFFVNETEIEFYLEVKDKQELHQDELRGQAFLDSALDKINEIQSNDFFTFIEVNCTPAEEIKSRKLKTKFRNGLTLWNRAN